MTRHAFPMTWNEFIGANNFSNIKKIEKLSDYVMRQQGKLLGNLIRADRFDLMRQPSLGDDLQQQEQVYKRVGRPRLKWIDANCDYMFMKLTGNEFDPEDPENINKLRDLALSRKF